MAFSGGEEGGRDGEEMEDPMFVVWTTHYITDEVHYITARSHL